MPDMNDRQFYVYIMASLSGVLYVGVTNDLVRRVAEHKSGSVEGFTKKYRCHRLVYYEVGGDAYGAITREKQLKGLLRGKKMAIIKAMNPAFEDLYEGLL